MATSVPVPMAMPTSACASAGASLMPSPTIPTIFFSCCKRLISPALSAGKTSAKTLVMPTCAATAAAVRWLSPVIITTASPNFCSDSMASLDSALSVSATATIPANCPFTAANIGVLPSAANFSAAPSASCREIFRSLSKRALPSNKSWPETLASIPRPSSALKLSTFSSVRFLSCAARTRAAASGCSLCFSAAAMSVSKSFSAQPSAVIISVRLGSPLVIVPVLSRTMVLSLCAVSRLAPPLMRMPFSAPRPVPTMIAVGVASPKAQGQAIISTETKLTKAIVKRTSGAAATNHTTKVAMARQITIGVKMPLMTSASRAIGGLEPCASCTSRTICCSAVSFPTFVAVNLNAPVLFIVAPKTSSPACFATGRLSPVNIDSSTADAPSTKRPSTGIFSPGRTITTSPGTTSAIAISCSAPLRQTLAVLGCRPSKRRIASPVWPFARASSQRPNKISAMMTLAASK